MGVNKKKSGFPGVGGEGDELGSGDEII